MLNRMSVVALLLLFIAKELHAASPFANNVTITIANYSMALEELTKTQEQNGYGIYEEDDDKRQGKNLQAGPALALALEAFERELVAEAARTACSLSPEPCHPGARYRTYSGRCNCLSSPDQGAAVQPLRRLLPSNYRDRVSAPRGAATGEDLPSARVVCKALHTGHERPDPRLSLLTMVWGQLIDHDITATPQPSAPGGGRFNCSSCSSASYQPACLPIPRSAMDGGGCMGFVRSLAGQRTTGPRQQVNQISSYLDGSMVYGSDPCTASALREQGGHLLRTSPHPLSYASSPLLPLLPTGTNPDCRAPNYQSGAGVLTPGCFTAGDDRANEQPGLTALHTLLVREHNHVAEGLRRSHPGWSAERTFQEARRVVVAEVQHLTYSEFLPRVLGSQAAARFGLTPLASGYYSGHLSSCSAGIFNEFAAAAYRFGHSLIGPNLTLLEEGAAPGGGRRLPLRQLFHNPGILREAGALDGLVRGMAMTPMMPADPILTPEVLHHLFELPGVRGTGNDLAALNIQRGRDHGIQGYVRYRKLCGLNEAGEFEELAPAIPLEQARRMASVYSSTSDIDLFTGILSEELLPGALVGPTGACIIGLQFRELRQCDRLWYESGDPAVAFTPAQLAQVRQQTLAKLLCRNTDGIQQLPRDALDLESPLLTCGDLPDWDYSAWGDLGGYTA